MDRAPGPGSGRLGNNAHGYTFQNNIITGNAVGMNINTVGPDVTLIRQNRFVANTKVPATNANSGTSIFITNGTSDRSSRR